MSGGIRWIASCPFIEHISRLALAIHRLCLIRRDC